jgi:hypothetical protein
MSALLGISISHTVVASGKSADVKSESCLRAGAISGASRLDSDRHCQGRTTYGLLWRNDQGGLTKWRSGCRVARTDAGCRSNWWRKSPEHRCGMRCYSATATTAPGYSRWTGAYKISLFSSVAAPLMPAYRPIVDATCRNGLGGSVRGRGLRALEDVENYPLAP